MKRNNYIQQFIDFFRTQDAAPRPGEEEIWQRIMEDIKQYERKKIRRKRHIYAYTSIGIAASICLAVYLGTSFMPYQQSDLEKYMASNVFQGNTSDSIQWKSGTRQITFDNDSLSIAYAPDGKVKLNQDIQNLPDEQEPNTFDEVIVPRGKHSFLTLEDGTTMHINSGTRVVYPQKFNGKQREIFVEGEVYLHVAKDSSHPFIVKTSQFQVKVLGTSFNVKSYRQDHESSVILVEGSVEIADKQNQKEILTPNHIATVTDGATTSISYINAKDYVAWTQGILIVHNESLEKVLRRLSRFYGKDFHIDEQIKQEIVNGKLDFTLPLEDVLRLISEVVPLYYHKDQDIYFINKK